MDLIMKDRLIKYTLKNHQKIKDFVLNEIDNFNGGGILPGDDESSVYKTDYFTQMEKSSRQIEKYFSFFEENARDFYDFILDYYYTPSIKIDNYWFQQYIKNDAHVWHVHPFASISYVYYVELEDSSLATEFFDIRTKKTFRPDVQEGDIIIFDSYIPHRSPKVLYDTRKTIISSNLNFNLCLDVERIENELSQ